MENYMTTRRVFIKRMLVAGAATALPMRALAADWPKQTVKLIVPFAAGGNTDGIARLIGQYLGAKLGASFIIENRLGAGGMIAASALARAAPDGYTMMMAALPQIAVLPVIEKADYDPKKDFTPISNVASNPFCLVANPQFEPKTLQEFVVYVKARPGKLAFASGGTGSLAHLTMVLFLQRAGLDMVHVPYKGGAPAIADVMGNQVPVYFANLSEALPHAGRGLWPLAVSGNNRAAKLPNVPTVDESGYPGFRSETWNGLIAPLGTPEAIVNTVAAEVRNALKDQVILHRLDGYGVDPIGSTPAEFKQTMADDIVQWSNAIKAANIKL
jgi:tripartite-type tricarboxylate transporter receptor subunit TctC